MSSREVLDAYDVLGNKLGFDLYRDEYRQRPQGVYHIIAEVYTITTNKEVLITQRHPDKGWPLKWEITGGCIQKGETPEEGALRELKEETGIIMQQKDLRFIYSYIMEGIPAIFYCYMIVIDKENTFIKLQDGETIDYRYISYNEFKRFIKTDDYVDLTRDRFNVHSTLFDDMISSALSH